jgi:hypothetical protein
VTDIPTITQDEMLERIKARLESRPHKSDYSHFNVAPAPAEPAAYVLILGAAYSCLFRYEGTNALFAPAHSEPRRKSYLDRL